MTKKVESRKKDAYGQEVWAYLNDQESYEIIEREDKFIAPSGGTESYFATFKDWPDHQKQGMQFIQGKILDIGAGAGRVALHLQEQGYEVTATDNSPLAIKVCRKRGVKKAQVLPLEEIGSLKPNYFDSVIMYGNGFGLLSSRTKAKTLLKKLHQITTPNAYIIAESNNPYKTKDPVHRSYHKLNRQRNRMPGQLKIRVRFRDHVSNWFDYLLVSPKEMKDILTDTGWKVREIIESDQSAYIAVLEKDNHIK